MGSVLVIDDERAIRDTIKSILAEEGYKVKTTDSIQGARTLMDAQSFDVILLDIWLPDGNGLDFLEEILVRSPQSRVVVITGHGKIEDAVKAIKSGAYDYIEKPFSLQKLLSSVSQASKETAQRESQAKNITDEIAGVSRAIREIKELLFKFAKTDVSVLITGESGTGKELLARTIHRLSPRRDGPFVDINCSAVPDELIEAELFGYEKGAFTGAYSSKKGKLEMAHGGTLFLDEIGEMSLRFQAKLLRVVETKSFTRLGSNRVIESDFRLISASNMDLEEAVRQGRFRSDLFYRICAIHIHIPPLRERREDIMPLVEHYTKLFCSKYSREVLTYTQSAVELFSEHPWRGNVRELKNFVERLVILHQGQRVDAQDIAKLLPARTSKEEGIHEEDLRRARQEFEKRFIISKLKEYNYDLKKVSQVIGLDLSNLYRKIKQYGIELK